MILSSISLSGNDGGIGGCDVVVAIATEVSLIGVSWETITYVVALYSITDTTATHSTAKPFIDESTLIARVNRSSHCRFLVS